MPDNNQLAPGQLIDIPKSNYDPHTEGGVLDHTGSVEAPAIKNLLLNTPIAINASGNGEPTVDQLFRNATKNSEQTFISTPKYSKASVAERFSNDSFGGYNPYDMNQENWYGEKQGWFTQMGNRLAKLGIKAAGSFAGALWDIPSMVHSVGTGQLDKMWDNPVNNWSNDLTEWSEKMFPNYKTNWEAEHPFLNLVPLYGNAGNGWGNVLEQSGFTIGAIGGAVVEDLLVGALTGGVGEVPLAAMQINKMVYRLGKTVGAGEEALSALKNSIRTGEDVIKGLKGVDRFNYAVRKGLWGANMISSGMGEAAFEGIESYKTLSKDLEKQFFDENGRMPTYEEKHRIDSSARDAANTRFLLNTALLAVTNSIQWGSLMRPFNVTKDLLEAEAKSGVKVALQEGSRDAFKAVEASSKLGKVGNFLKNNFITRTLSESGSEGFEEGAQFAIQNGVDDYYKRKYNNEGIEFTNNFMKSFGTGMSKALGTQEGWENIVYGLLGGALFKAGEHAYEKFKGVESPNHRKEIDAVVQGLNSVSLTGMFENKYGEATAAAAIEKDLKAAAKSGDLFAYKNFKHEHFVNFVLSGIKQNKFDTRMEQLSDLKKLKEEEFQKTFGVPATSDNRKSVEQMVSKMESNARYMKDVHDRVSRTFINPFPLKGTGNYKNAEGLMQQVNNSANHVAYEEAKEQLVAAMAMSKDSQDRIAELQNKISTIDPRVSVDTMVNLSSVDGIKRLAAEHKEKIKTLEQSLKIAEDAKTKQELAWTREQLANIESLFTEKDDAKRTKTYNKVIADTVGKQLEGLDGTKAPLDVLKINEMLELGADVDRLKERNKAAIDNYAKLTTKGGFKKVFNDIQEIRKELAKKEVPLDPEKKAPEAIEDEPETALPQDLLDQAIAAAKGTNGATPNNGAVNTQEITEQVPLPKTQKVRLNQIVVGIVDGTYAPREDELTYLGFKIAEDILFDDPKADLEKDYVKVKGISGMDYYMSKDDVAKARIIAAEGDEIVPMNTQLTEGGHAPQNIDPNPPAQNQPPAGGKPGNIGTEGMFVENFMAKIFVPTDLQPAFRHTIFSTKPEEIKKDITISVKPLEEKYKRAYDEQKRTGSYMPYTGFEGVYVSKAPIDLSISHKGVEIGKVAFPERLLFKVGNDFVTIDKLTPQQYQQFTGKPAATYQTNVDEFKKQVAFKNYLASRFKENGLQPVTLSAEELSSLFDIQVSYGELDLVRSDKDRPTYNNLELNKVKITDPKGNEHSTLAIVSTTKRYQGDVGSRQRSESMTIIHGKEYYESGTTKSGVIDFVRSTPGAIIGIGSRYVGVAELPNGQYALVALRAGEMAKEDKQAMFTSIKERATETIKENVIRVENETEADYTIQFGEETLYYKHKSDESKKFNDEFNNKLADATFISDVNEKMWFGLSVSPMGAVRLEVYDPQSGYNNIVWVSAQKIQSIDTFDQFIEELRKEVTKKASKDAAFAALKVNITAENFRQNIPHDNETTAEFLADHLTAATTTNVTKNASMKLVPNGTALTQANRALAQKLKPAAPEAQAAPVSDIEAKKAEIEARRKEELSKLSVAEYQSKAYEINMRYNKEIADLTKTTAPYGTMAAEYLLNSGVDAIKSTDYFLQALSGAFANASSLIEDIRNKYAKEIADAKLTELKDFVGSDLFNKILNDVKEAIDKSYTNKTEAQEILDQILKYPAGLPNKLGNEVSIKLDNLNKSIQATTEQAVQDAISPTPTQPIAISMEGLTVTPTDEQGRPQLIEETPKITETQESTEDIIFPNIKAALASKDIEFFNDPVEGVMFRELSTGKIIETMKGVAPIDLAKTLGLKWEVVKKKESSDEDFDFKLNLNHEEVTRQINIENAKQYLASILPSFIKIDDISKVLDKISVNGEVFGAFSNGVIYLNKAAQSGTEYHEAFHGIFRMLLSDEQIDNYLETAQNELYKKLKKEGKSLREVLAEKRAIGLYKNISDREAYDRIYEEHMADRFQAWKQKKEDAGFFQKLFDLLNRLFKWITRDKKDLDMLFNKIDTGKYKYSNVAANRFTRNMDEEAGLPEFAFALIPARPGSMQVAKSTITVKRNLDAKTSKQAVQNVAAYYSMYKEFKDGGNFTDDQILDRILDDLKNTYDVNNPLYAGRTEEQKRVLAASDNSYIYANKESRDIIKEEAKKYIAAVKHIDEFDEDVENELEQEQEYGSDSPGMQFDNRAENKGGISSLPKFLRQYIGFTSYEKTDEFGNSELVNAEGKSIGVKTIATVDSLAVYYGLLRSLANITDPVKFFQRMVMFGGTGNEQTHHFVSKFIADTGLDTKALFEGRLVADKNRALAEMIKKGFNKYRIDYVFTEQDIKKRQSKSYHANRKNVENVQFDSWANNFINGYVREEQASQQAARFALEDVINEHFDPRRLKAGNKYDDTFLDNTAVPQLYKALSAVGITVSKEYIKYSLLAANAKEFDTLNEDYKKQGTSLQFDDPQNKFITKQQYDYVQIMKIPEAHTLDRELFEQLAKSLAADTNPYFKEVRETQEVDDNTGEIKIGEEEIDTAMIGRLTNIARGNAIFDESVGESSYMNAEGKLVYAHQDGTFNVKGTYQLRDAAFRRQLRETGIREALTAYKDEYDKEWLTNNMLLNSKDFEAIADNLLFQRIDGMRAVETNSMGAVITAEFRDQKEGVTYGDYSPREFIVNLMNMYISFAKRQTTSTGEVMTAPHLIRVLESSKTGDTVNLPIQLDVFRGGSVTEKTVNQIHAELGKEFRRIRRVQGEIGKLDYGVVENYHTGSFKEDGYTVDKGYRGLQFTDTITQLLSKGTVTELERVARDPQGSYSVELEKKVKSELAESLNKMVTDTIDIMVAEGIITKDAKGSYGNQLLYAGGSKQGKDSKAVSTGYFAGDDSLNLKAVKKPIDFVDNIGHVIMNDFINTLAYNQILHGDSALGLKNDGGRDAVKRAKGDNAAIVSMRTDFTEPSLGIHEVFTHSKVAIFKEPKGWSEHVKKNIDIADAQMYSTVKGLRYTLWGLGRLDKNVARVLDALEAGEDIHNIKIPVLDENGKPVLHEDGKPKYKKFDGVFDENDGLLEIDKMTNSLKLVYKDGKSYFKMSVVMLQPNLTSYKVWNPKTKQNEWKPRPGWETLHNMRTKMEADGIHFAAPQSASKMMTLDVASDNKEFSDLKGHLFNNEYFGLQTENPSNKLEITTPTQLLQIIDSEQDNNADVYYNGKTIKVGELKNLYQSYVSQKVSNAYATTKQEIYKIEDFNKDIQKSIADGQVVPQLAEFQKRAVEALEASGSDAQLIDFFSLDENGQPKYNLNMSATKTKFAQLYLSYFSKGVLSQKNPGYTVALFSGMDTKVLKRAKRIVDGKVVEWDVVRREQFDNNYGNVQSENYHASKEQVTKEGQLFLGELEYNVPEYNEKGEIIGYYSEMMLPPHYKELLNLALSDDKLPDAIAKMFGVRIPSQDKHSFMSFRLVDLLPANLGSTGMFPKELIALSGADFDIDKEFISRYDFYTETDKYGNKIFKKYGDAKTDEGRWNEYKMWMSKNNKTVKNLIKKLSKDDPEFKKKMNEAMTHEVLTGNNDLKNRYFEGYLVQALAKLNLPSTLEEFTERSKTQELNNGVINNRIVDAYVGLLTNDGIRDVAKTPATLTALADVQNEDDLFMKDKNGNKIGESVFSQNINFPVDSLAGKYYAFRNNTTGKNNIGIDVNANLIYSVLNKGDITLRNSERDAFVFDGKAFDTFAGDREYNLETKEFDGRRTNDIISTLISAATDEAKEQLNALYNLNVDALKVVDYLVGLKVNLKTAIYLVNQPAIRNYLQIKSVRQNTIQTDAEEKLSKTAFKEEAIKKTAKEIKDYREMSADEIVSVFEGEGLVQVEC